MKYSLSIIVYPRDNGGYHVTCPELKNCYTCGTTIEEAEANIRGLIAECLPEEISKSAIDEETFREGLCRRGKMFREIEAEVASDGAVVFPLEEPAEALTKTA
jgi:predicted RNase H-like HicB family nuclease